MKSNPAIIRFLGTRFAVFTLSVLIAYLLASVSATQSVASSLAGMGVDLDPGQRLSMTLADLGGLAGSLLPLIAFGFIIAFPAAALLYRLLRRWRTGLYLLAGATALVAVHLLMKLVLGVTPVAIARSFGGLFVQGIAGAVGAAFYATVQNRLQRPGRPE